MKTMHLIVGLILTAWLPALAADPMAPIDPAAYKQAVKVACVGDSITQGKKGGNYPEQLQALLGDKWQVENFGHSGRTLLKKGDHSYWTSERYTKALEFKPDVVIIKLGTNDTKPQNWQHKAEFVSDYRELIKSFQALASKPRIYLCRPCPVIGKGNFGIVESGVQEQIPLLDALAKELNLGIIDMHATLADKPELIPDCVHPSKEGYGLMAATAFKALTGKEAPAAAPAK
ncbi:MAG TPA: GDSL-type esterase/lipase family protein [Luteolibacter sp.]|nr:GDSL-type esterase/lipase family protein [Luteolibacter sp.]